MCFGEQRTLGGANLGDIHHAGEHQLEDRAQCDDIHDAVMPPPSKTDRMSRQNLAPARKRNLAFMQRTTSVLQPVHSIE